MKNAGRRDISLRNLLFIQTNYWGTFFLQPRVSSLLKKVGGGYFAPAQGFHPNKLGRGYFAPTPVFLMTEKLGDIFAPARASTPKKKKGGGLFAPTPGFNKTNQARTVYVSPTLDFRRTSQGEINFHQPQVSTTHVRGGLVFSDPMFPQKKGIFRLRHRVCTKMFKIEGNICTNPGFPHNVNIWRRSATFPPYVRFYKRSIPRKGGINAA